MTWDRFNLSYATNKAALARHELGHAVGLRHRTASDSCMESPLNGSTALGTHDKVDGINWWY